MAPPQISGFVTSGLAAVIVLAWDRRAPRPEPCGCSGDEWRKVRARLAVVESTLAALVAEGEQDRPTLLGGPIEQRAGPSRENGTLGRSMYWQIYADVLSDLGGISGSSAAPNT